MWADLWKRAAAYVGSLCRSHAGFDQQMLRRRQVRLGYPQAFVELATVLAVRHGRRDCARVLGLPLSTVYRWLEHSRRGPERIDRIQRSGHDWLDELIGACEAHGFDLRQRIAALEPLAANSAAASGRENPRAIFHARAPARGRAMPNECAQPAHAASTHKAGDLRAASLAPGVRARVALAHSEIDRHYYSQLSCEMLAGVAGMSRFHFIRTFKAAFSVAPYRYLMQVRIHHARLLLSTTRQPLDAVAAAVGFDTQSSLCKAFRSIEGVSLATFFHGVRLGTSPPRVAAPNPRSVAISRTA
jgi:AraC-like DNA-binding protein